MEILIRFANGSLQVGGNVKDKLQAVGLLEMAKAAILAQPVTQGVQVPPPDVQKLLTG